MNTSRSLAPHALAGGAKLLVLVCLLGGCNDSPTPVYVPIEYRPSRAKLLEPVARVPEPVKLFVKPVAPSDTSKPQPIGESMEKKSVGKDTPRPVMPSGTPAEFVREALIRELRSAGVFVVDRGDQSQRNLQLTLQKFWVTETVEAAGDVLDRVQVWESSTRNYTADVAVTVELTDPAGNVLWSGQKQGTASNKGGEHSDSNFQEALSDAAINLVRDVIKDDTFRSALQK